MMSHRFVRFALLSLVGLSAACGGTGAGPRAQAPRAFQVMPTQLPDTAWGTHVLVAGRARDGRTWVGTYGRGIFVFRSDSARWEQIASKSGDSTSLSWNFVNSLAFPPDSSIWYGTVGNGWGRSTDGGRTWQNWKFSELGPEWQYVAPDGIRNRGDTIYIATADGLRITSNSGKTWRCIQATQRVAGGSTAKSIPCAEQLNSLPTEYLLSIDVSPKGEIWVGHMSGISMSTDQGRTWHTFTEQEGAPHTRVRAVLAQDTLGAVWAITENAFYKRARPDSAFRKVDVKLPGWPNGFPGGLRGLYPSFGTEWPIITTSFGMAAADFDGTYRLHYLPAGELYRPSADIWDMMWWGPPPWPIAASGTGLNLILAGNQLPGVASADAPLVTARDPSLEFFERPIADTEGNPHIDATYRYGSTMGGNFQQHQGVEFNNPAGTPVHAIGSGVVVYSGEAEAGAKTVAILHDRRVDNRYIYSVYYHNSLLLIARGNRVNAGDVIARVGNTGRATNDHLHLEVHVAPSLDSAAIVNPQERYPKYTTNPQLWIRPLPGTGIVAGRVRDAEGKPIPGARVYGLVLPFPEETPFSFAETYRERAHSAPGYDEDFAVGDVPAGTYLLGVEIGGVKVWRRARVAAGRVTFVEFAPARQ